MAVTLPPTRVGFSRPLDTSSDGIVFGEACASIVLQRDPVSSQAYQYPNPNPNPKHNHLTLILSSIPGSSLKKRTNPNPNAS